MEFIRTVDSCSGSVTAVARVSGFATLGVWLARLSAPVEAMIKLLVYLTALLIPGCTATRPPNDGMSDLTCTHVVATSGNETRDIWRSGDRLVRMQNGPLLLIANAPDAWTMDASVHQNRHHLDTSSPSWVVMPLFDKMEDLMELEFGREREFFAAHGLSEGARRVLDLEPGKLIGIFGPEGTPRSIELRGRGAPWAYVYRSYETKPCSSAMFQPPKGVRFLPGRSATPSR
jgi:hypothetical protein